MKQAIGNAGSCSKRDDWPPFLSTETAGALTSRAPSHTQSKPRLQGICIREEFSDQSLSSLLLESNTEPCEREHSLGWTGRDGYCRHNHPGDDTEDLWYKSNIQK